MEKLYGTKLDEFLGKRNAREYTHMLHVLRSLGNADLAVTDMYAFAAEQDLVIVFKYLFNGTHFYFEITDGAHLEEAERLVRREMHGAAEYMLSSNREALFSEEAFLKRFGKHQVSPCEMYAMFHPLRTDESDEHIRLLLPEDEALVQTFSEQRKECAADLCSTFEAKTKQQNQNYRIYGYIEGKALLGYIICNTYEGLYWDIANIYVCEEARGQGIAKKLAAHYAADTAERGGFASYGSPVNEASKKVALACGFERYECIYMSDWSPAATLFGK